MSEYNNAETNSLSSQHATTNVSGLAFQTKDLVDDRSEHADRAEAELVCRKYVKSQRARGGYRHTSTHRDTGTQWSKNEETRE